MSPTANSVLITNNYTVDPQQDLGASSIELNLFADDPSDLQNMEVINGTPRPLFQVTLKMDDCQKDPELEFIQGQMTGLSTYFQPSTFPLPLVYDPLEAIDQSNTPPCGCAGDPTITGFGPTTAMVAGDNQILTITGTNFGVYERSGNPTVLGTRSSVLFTNGDVGASDPGTIAASDDDIISWTDTEIKVKVPSVDYQAPAGVGGTAATGGFFVRNRCNNSASSEIDLLNNPGFNNGELNIAYSLANARITADGPARKLGLRNDNGINGSQDGYVFAFGTKVTGPNVNINIKDAFNGGLNVWCGVTNIRFKTQQASASTNLSTPVDGENTITVEPLSNSSTGEAGMVQGSAYFPINCQATQANENGGYILTDIDIRVAPDFAQNGTQARAVEAMTHELGHAHMLNHAFCFGANCTEPLMEGYGGAGAVQQADSDGANRVFNTSSGIINSNTCFLTGPGGGMIAPIPIQSGDCGAVNPTFEIGAFEVTYFPNPAISSIIISNLLHSGKYLLYSSSGKLLESGDFQVGDYEMDVSAYPQGTYIVKLVIGTESGHFKIVKL
ncbi:MAG: T9SS type A sorting domain-containing protein [Saprospiraceae bacterium]|nr:MAG: T9SS type A sorting domain-containing protein [Saprospiraceae bacterium]